VGQRHLGWARRSSRLPACDINGLQVQFHFQLFIIGRIQTDGRVELVNTKAGDNIKILDRDV